MRVETGMRYPSSNPPQLAILGIGSTVDEVEFLNGMTSADSVRTLEMDRAWPSSSLIGLDISDSGTF